MKWRQLLTRKYWWQVMGYFIWLFIIYTIVSYFFPDEEKAFWSLEEITSRTSLALFVALIITYSHREQPLSTGPNDQDMEQNRWTAGDFLGVFGLTLLFSLLLMSILFGLAWLAMPFFTDSIEPAGKIYLKSVMVMAVLAFMITVLLWFTDRVGIWWSRRSA